MPDSNPITLAEICAALGCDEALVDETIANVGRLSAQVGRRNPIREVRVDGERMFSIDPGFAEAVRRGGFRA